MSDDIYSIYSDEDAEETAYQRVNLAKFGINDLEKVLKNRLAYHPKQLDYVEFLHRILIDNYNGWHIDKENAEKKLKILYDLMPQNLQW